MRRFSLIAICFLSLLFTLQTASVWACSGFPYFSLEDLPEMDLIVEATAIDTDDRGYSAVIRVENYYKGEGDLFLTVMRYPSALATGALVRGYDTDCLYAGRGDRWVTGARGYFALRSNGDGTYTDSYGGSAHFYPINGEITFQQGATEGYATELNEPLTLPEDEFVALLLEAGDREQPVTPDVHGETPIFYPLMRFLEITTENGTRYQVNPDRSVREMPTDGALAISPDGAHVAFRLDDRTLAFQYIWTTPDMPENSLEYQDFVERFSVPGQAVAFSNDSNLAAAWDRHQIGIYMLRNDDIDHTTGYGNGMRVQEVARVELEGNQMPRVLWSADSSTLVWQDGTRLWRWNFIEDAEPSEIPLESALESLGAESPSLIDTSLHGRYVRIGQPSQPNRWVLVDANTGEWYGNAVASPPEQFVVYLNPDGAQIGESSCRPPLRETCPAVISTYQSDVEMVFPYRYNLVGLVACESESPNCRSMGRSWHPAITVTDYIQGRNIDISGPLPRQIVYDPQYGIPAIVYDDYQLMFDFYYQAWIEDPEVQPYLDRLDLEGVIDSPIASIQWGQMVFYDEYLLSTPEFMPRPADLMPRTADPLPR